MCDYKIIEKPGFNVLGKSKDFEFEKFVKEGPKFWKEYVSTDEYLSLCGVTNGRSGPVAEAPLLSIYFPKENGERDQFTDVLCVETSSEVEANGLDNYSVPSATYAEFDCTYQTSMKTNKYIYGEWFASTGYERDGNKPDIAAYFPTAFRSIKEMGIRWWVPIIKKS